MWFALIILSGILLAGYGFLIENYRRWFTKIVPFSTQDKPASTITFSIIIPARNEEKNLQLYLPAVLHQQYPTHQFEVIVIDDHSTDNTAKVVEQLQQQCTNLRLLNLQQVLAGKTLNSYKKKAIELAVATATGNYIVTTDADCLPSKNWLNTLGIFIEEQQAVFVAAPVKFFTHNTFLSIFQSLDFISLQGITAASVHGGFHSMCNGANLAYQKHLFNEVGGFAGIDNIASGDDMLLMHKIFLKHPQGVKFLLSPQAIVETTPMENWKQFINQRIRWASKAESYDDKRIFWVLALVYLLNALLFVLLPASLFQPFLLLWWLLLVLAKTLIELRFMVPVALFFGEKKILKWFAFMQPFHIFYTVVAGWLGKFGSYQWKGRKVK